ncbi:zinc finger protein 34-like [Hydractinia symbiolongicarpus]|uniref:zinc finger protein 34-like n=1 Tax=Hydractinia symbiolongicarpus TaxID=13093 RepID=UPI0025508BE8|nr:zinc finger protein 34-like [Hydractinia symbiolongicarpus]
MSGNDIIFPGNLKLLFDLKLTWTNTTRTIVSNIGKSLVKNLRLTLNEGINPNDGAIRALQVKATGHRVYTTDFFFNGRYALFIEFRASPDHILHGSGRPLQRLSDGITLHITKKADGNFMAYVYLLQDAQLNILEEANTTNNMEESKSCSKYKHVWALDAFKVLKNGQRTKQCICCLHKAKRQLTKNKCPHDRIRCHCKECGGGSICPQQRLRSKCKESGRSQICPHQRQRSHCKECRGSQICPYQRDRSYCKDCGGSQICPHQRQRSQCKECGGSKICTHQRQRAFCKDCGSSQICPHQRQRGQSKECGRRQICPHQRERSRCKECGGSHIRPHQRKKYRCKDCKKGKQ